MLKIMTIATFLIKNQANKEFYPLQPARWPSLILLLLEILLDLLYLRLLLNLRD